MRQHSDRNKISWNQARRACLEGHFVLLGKGADGADVGDRFLRHRGAVCQRVLKLLRQFPHKLAVCRQSIKHGEKEAKKKVAVIRQSRRRARYHRTTTKRCTQREKKNSGERRTADGANGDGRDRGQHDQGEPPREQEDHQESKGRGGDVAEQERHVGCHGCLDHPRVRRQPVDQLARPRLVKKPNFLRRQWQKRTRSAMGKSLARHTSQARGEYRKGERSGYVKGTCSTIAWKTLHEKADSSQKGAGCS